MSEYTNFPIDFVKRTKANLSDYSGDFEVTNLINSCLGLIIIPKQRISDRIPTYEFTEQNCDFGITLKNICFEQNKNYELSNILRHIRNGLAHGRIEQKSKNGEIAGLRIYDKNNNSGENFSIEFSVEEFKRFAISVSNKFIEED